MELPNYKGKGKAIKRAAFIKSTFECTSIGQPDGLSLLNGARHSMGVEYRWFNAIRDYRRTFLSVAMFSSAHSLYV